MDTVETRILCQAVRNGTSIYLADQQAGDRAIDSMLNVSSSARSGGDLALNHSDSTGNAELLSLIM
jgi:E3 ubiquitin-protein ligase SHPRH